MATKKIIKKVSTEELILGGKNIVEEIKTVDYQNKKKKYKITILSNMRVITADGQSIDFFIGSKNREARENLKNGDKTVFVKDNANNNMYKIEVVE